MNIALGAAFIAAGVLVLYGFIALDIGSPTFSMRARSRPFAVATIGALVLIGAGVLILEPTVWETAWLPTTRR